MKLRDCLVEDIVRLWLDREWFVSKSTNTHFRTIEATVLQHTHLHALLGLQKDLCRDSWPTILPPETKFLAHRFPRAIWVPLCQDTVEEVAVRYQGYNPPPARLEGSFFDLLVREE